MKKVLIFALLILITIGFIWGNSIKTVEQSSTQSTSIAELLRPILDPNYRLDKGEFHNLVRKLAHLAEFFVLGLFVVGFSLSLGTQLEKRFVSLPILMVLLVAVIDEYIQHFTGRGSLVTDVILDFAGAVTGIGVVALLRWAIQWIKYRIMYNRSIRRS